MFHQIFTKNQELIRNAYSAFNARNIDAILQVMHQRWAFATNGYRVKVTLRASLKIRVHYISWGVAFFTPELPGINAALIFIAIAGKLFSLPVVGC